MRHQAALQRMGAAGIVVSAADEAAFKALQRAAPALPLGSVQGAWLEGRLLARGIKAYPVLIGLDGRSLAAPEDLQP